MTAAAVSSAQAQDAAYDWSGTYVGVTGGYAAGKARHPSQTDLFFNKDFIDGFIDAGLDLPSALDLVIPLFFDLCACDVDHSTISLADGWYNLPLGDYLGSGSASFGGAVAGAHIGHNWQSGSLVYGVEADIQLGSLEAGHRSPTIYLGLPIEYSARTRLDWTGTVRGRVGWAWDRVLAYGTGGLAFARATSEIGALIPFLPPPNYESWSHDEGLRTGLVAGAGLEIGMTDRVSLRMEYLYTSFGSKTLPGIYATDDPGDPDNAFAAVGIGFKSNVSMHTIRGGISIRF